MKRSARWWLRLVLVAAVLLIVVPMVMILPWRWIDPPTSAFILRARVAGYDVQQSWIDLDQMSASLPLAVVAAEDQRFPDHRGFDLESIRSAWRERDRRQRGASTLSQQVAKNLFLWSGQSWIRKGIEAYLTGFVEVLWPKRRILEVYLNLAELGPGIFGVEAASQQFFGRSAASVTARQAATLAAVLPNPKRMSAADPSPYVEDRVDWILEQMRQLGGSAYLDSL